MPSRPQDSALATTSRASLEPQIPWHRRLPPLPLPPHQILRMATSTLTAIRYLPIFTPRQTLARWRSQRAMREAARQARRKGKHDRDWNNRFRLNGLTWHHLYITQDLRRIQLFLRELAGRENRELAVVKGLVGVERSYSFLMDNIWDVYNTLERQIFFPWIERGVGGDVDVVRALLMFGKERGRIEDASDAVLNRFTRAVCATGYGFTSLGGCQGGGRRLNASKLRKEKRRKEKMGEKVRKEALLGLNSSDQEARGKKEALKLTEAYKPEVGKEVVLSNLKRVNRDELRQISLEIGELIEDTERLHRMERGLLYPIIADKFDEKEQARVTNVMVYSMRSALAKLIITIYHQAVEKNATRAHWKYYKREVPLPIRVYTPVWRKRLYDGSPLGWLRQTAVKDVGVDFGR